MPRTSRLIISDEKAVYHVMSRTALDGFPLKDVEKDFLLDLMKKFSALYFTEILGFCFTQLNSLRRNGLQLCPAK